MSSEPDVKIAEDWKRDIMNKKEIQTDEVLTKFLLLLIVQVNATNLTCLSLTLNRDDPPFKKGDIVLPSWHYTLFPPLFKVSPPKTV